MDAYGRRIGSDVTRIDTGRPSEPVASANADAVPINPRSIIADQMKAELVALEAEGRLTAETIRATVTLTLARLEATELDDPPLA